MKKYLTIALVLIMLAALFGCEVAQKSPQVATETPPKESFLLKGGEAWDNWVKLYGDSSESQLYYTVAALLGKARQHEVKIKALEEQAAIDNSTKTIDPNSNDPNQAKTQ